MIKDTHAMVAAVISLESSLYLKDVQSIIAYTLRRYFKNIKNAVPYLSDQIISLTSDIALYQNNPEELMTAIQKSLNSVFGRIFNGERQVTATASHSPPDGKGAYTITIAIVYTTVTGDIEQTGTSFKLSKEGQIVLPQDTLSLF